MPIKLSLRNFVKYFCATPSGKRKVLRDEKYPNPEGHAQIVFYREARKVIKEFHRGTRDLLWMREQSKSLNDGAAKERPQVAVRLKSNARAIDMYSKNFGSKKFTVLENLGSDVIFGDVRISVRPDLHVRESGRERVIKLDFTKLGNSLANQIAAQLVFQASVTSGWGLKPADCLVYGLSTGNEFKGRPLGSRLLADINVECDNIGLVWDNI